jgi:hypothetical protein
VCDPGWITLPFGVNDTMAPGCGYLDLGQAAITECGAACAFHGGLGGVDVGTTSWGGSVNKDPADGKYVMFAAEHCSLGQWTTNSQVVMAKSDTPTGPFVRHGVAIPPWSHNPEAVLAPDGTWVIYTLGPGFGLKPVLNCTTGSPSAAAAEDLESAAVEEPVTIRSERGAASGLITVNFTIPHVEVYGRAVEIDNNVR